jgi:hypothetical protein
VSDLKLSPVVEQFSVLFRMSVRRRGEASECNLSLHGFAACITAIGLKLLCLADLGLE